ncbi:hypothetical protein FSP39_025075 [Pinctada imbricata]|uniref:Uncharacterized protein n=1 Tax=Pinctada imbricata TaxID=66713 RepID=A0AA89BJW0_PINIB|nr:hypothetical protein FSP39_025075 [Pinctada imbricata]
MNDNPEVFSALLKDESVCLLTDLVCVKDKILIVDNENRKIKRFTMKGNLVDILILNDPYGISNLILSSHVVLTEPKVTSISFVSTDGRLALSSRRKCSKKYQSVCCIDETRLAVGCYDTGNASVEIIDYIGNVLRTMSPILHIDSSFRNPKYLCYLNNKYILVSDSGLRKLVGISPDKNVDFEYDPKCTPGGVTVDSSDAMYLCLCDRNCIHQLDIEKKKTSRIFSDEKLKLPSAVTTSKKYLIVIQERNKNDVIMFKVSHLLI